MSVSHHRLNAIAPYFTMFPLDFPIGVLSDGKADPSDSVLDPFCGRGTTNYAARALGLKSAGIDSSPVAAAIAQAKLTNASAREVVGAAETILTKVRNPMNIPSGDFWELAFHSDTLDELCRLREGLLTDCSSDDRIGLRALILGILHGPRNKGRPSYFSNQCQRTYAPKPAYAVRFWQSRGLYPARVDALSLIAHRAETCFGAKIPPGNGRVILGDARRITDVQAAGSGFSWVITSPPYYGLRTYRPDQWLRNWFVGGSSEVDYSNEGQLTHRSPDAFAGDLASVWRLVGRQCRPGARLVMRFGSIHDRAVDATSLALASFQDTGWHVTNVTSAGSADGGRRQALHFAGTKRPSREEIDVTALWTEESC